MKKPKKPKSSKARPRRGPVAASTTPTTQTIAETAPAEALGTNSASDKKTVCTNGGLTAQGTLNASFQKLKSAFRLVYAGIFIFATWGVGQELLPKMSGEAAKLSSGWLDFWLISVFLCGFVIGVCVHGLRVYLTFEMVEDRNSIFKSLVDQIKQRGRFVRLMEFCARTTIIAIVTAKASGQRLFAMSEFTDVCYYLIWLYLALLFWSLIVFLGVQLIQDDNWASRRRKWSESYGNIALLGLGGASSLLMLYQGPNPIAAALVLAVLTLMIWWNLVGDFVRHRKDYCGYLGERLFVGW